MSISNSNSISSSKNNSMLLKKGEFFSLISCVRFLFPEITISLLTSDLCRSLLLRIIFSPFFPLLSFSVCMSLFNHFIFFWFCLFREQNYCGDLVRWWCYIRRTASFHMKWWKSRFQSKSQFRLDFLYSTHTFRFVRKFSTLRRNIKIGILYVNIWDLSKIERRVEWLVFPVFLPIPEYSTFTILFYFEGKNQI